MLTDKQIKIIVDKINEKIDIPKIGEKFEGILIKFIVKQIDKLLEDKLPQELYETITNISDGIDDSELEIIKTNLTNFVNKHINLPLLDEEQEEKVIILVVDILVNAMRKGEDVESVLNK
jgi:hypothetical protein